MQTEIGLGILSTPKKYSRNNPKTPISQAILDLNKEKRRLILYSHQNLSCLKSGVDFSGFIGNDTVEE